jgi:hypothetical protein
VLIEPDFDSLDHGSLPARRFLQRRDPAELDQDEASVAVDEARRIVKVIG